MYGPSPCVDDVARDDWPGVRDWGTATNDINLQYGTTDSATDTIIDESMCAALTHIDLIYLWHDGWCMESVTVTCGEYAYTAPSYQWFDGYYPWAGHEHQSIYTETWFRKFELVSPSASLPPALQPDWPTCLPTDLLAY